MTDAPFPPEVLVIDDEVQIRRLLRVTLEGAGFRVREAESGDLGLVEAATKRPDAIILDLGLPDLPGIEVLKRLREWSRLPVLILSVRGQEADKIEALDAGADDYLSKPFGGGELLARLRAMLRRVQTREEESGASFGDVEIDFARRTVMKAGKAVKLTPKEYGLLRLLVLHRGRVITHRQILRELWGPKAEEQTQYLRVYMTHLRQKLEDDPNRPAFFKTETGIGYRFSAE
jgi:two-component system, OmpR family, KDP operon response regulator KdpE